MLVKDGSAAMPFGVMGGHYQSIGHAHFLMQCSICGLDPQAAAEAPRSFAFDGDSGPRIDVSDAVVAGLARARPSCRPGGHALGGCQAIWIDRENGCLLGGSDPRKDGCALGY